MKETQKDYSSTENSSGLRVVVSMDSSANGWERLAPGHREGSPVKVGGCEFVLNPTETIDADYWITFANAPRISKIRCAAENTLFIAGEPAEKKVYRKGFYRQFHRLIDTHNLSGHPRIELHAPCLSWHVGLNHRSAHFDLGHAELSAMGAPSEVSNKVSVICSDATFTEGQRKRLRFLEELKQLLGDRLVHFGRGFEPVDDKLDAIRGYRFHLVMENCITPHYWTEKLADAFLGWAKPLYVGAPNIHEYFAQETLESLDIDSVEDAAKRISSLLDQPHDEEETQAVALGRERILNHYNPWCAWARWAKQFHTPATKAQLLTIRSHKAFRPFPRGLAYRLKGLLG